MKRIVNSCLTLMISLCLIFASVTTISAIDNPVWNTYFGSTDMSHYEETEGRLTENTDDVVKARIDSFGWAGVWGGYIHKPISITQGKKYNLSCAAISDTVDKYIYVNVGDRNTLAFGYWIKLPAGQKNYINIDFVAQSSARAVCICLGGDFGDREGMESDVDAKRRYDVFDEQFKGVETHNDLMNNDCSGDPTGSGTISIQGFQITEVTPGGETTAPAVTTQAGTEPTKSVDPIRKTKLVIKHKNQTLKAKTLKKKKVVLKKAIKAKFGSYKLKYKKLSGSKALTVNKKGYVIVKKGTKKGTYKIKVKVWCKNKSASCTQKVTVKVKVK